MAYFFATLFVHNPELRPMFPLALDDSRAQMFEALTRCVWASDRPETLTGWLTELARDHRKYGVAEHHYQPFCDALLAAVRTFSDGSWSAQTQAAWAAALHHIAATLAAAARRFAGEPAWWVAEVVEHDRRRPDLAVLGSRTKDIVISGPAGLVARAAEVVPPHAPGARVHFDPLPGGTVAPVPH